MSEKEKKIIESIAKAVPNMSEFDKGYFRAGHCRCAKCQPLLS